MIFRFWRRDTDIIYHEGDYEDRFFSRVEILIL